MFVFPWIVTQLYLLEEAGDFLTSRDGLFLPMFSLSPEKSDANSCLTAFLPLLVLLKWLIPSTRMLTKQQLMERNEEELIYLQKKCF